MVLIKGEGAGDAINGAACDSIDDGLLIVVITSGQAGILSSLNAVDNGHGSIVAQRSEAVGILLAVLSLVGVLKVGVGALCVVCAEVGVLQLGVRCVAFQTIPAVAAQEGNCQTDALSLSQDLTDFLIVVGAEHHFGSLAQNGGQLGLVVHIALRVGLLIDDGAAQALELVDEVLCQTLVVVSALLEDDGCLGVAQPLVSVVSHLDALERVGEGCAEHILVHGVGLGIVGDSLSGSGSGDHGHVVVCALGSKCQSRGGGNIAHQSGDALIAHLGEAGNSLSCIALLIHGDDLQLLAVDAALFVDLLQVQGSAVDNGLTVNGNITGQRSKNAHLDGVAGSSGTRSCGRGGSSSAVGRTAACSQNAGCSNNTCSGQEITTRNHLFHSEYPP